MDARTLWQLKEDEKLPPRIAMKHMAADLIWLSAECVRQGLLIEALLLRMKLNPNERWVLLKSLEGEMRANG